ncbi:MAG: type III-B CRISPR module RAMP protein Cmr6 [Bacteroidetes bacterium]|nr:type III-B CRISPR module RAMP protein Cmr6 [Bacteroidota bacterium]
MPNYIKLTNNTNLGWHYFKNYFNDLPLIKIVENSLVKAEKEALEIGLKARNIEIQEYKPNIAVNRYYTFTGNKSIMLKTTYPGLLIGTGLKHEISAIGEAKLGFHFDFSTGLPSIPGSSIKGLLRSAFPGWCLNEIGDEIKWAKTYYIESVIESCTIDDIEIKFEQDIELKNELQKKINALEMFLFEGKIPSIGNDDSYSFLANDPFWKPISIYNRCLFLDAFIVKATSNLMYADTLAPHHPEKPESSDLLNPIPLSFIKIAPEVHFQFNFKLFEYQDYNIGKINFIFKQILIHLGVGAKTNVGYGQLIESGERPIVADGTSTASTAVNIELIVRPFPGEFNSKLAPLFEYEGRIVGNKKDKYFIEIIIDSTKAIYSKKLQALDRNNISKEINTLIICKFSDPRTFSITPKS